MKVVYELSIPGKSPLQFAVDTERPASSGLTADLPAWTALDYHQCPNCPLRKSESPACPAAVDALPLVQGSANLLSHSVVQVQVELGGKRKLNAECDLQTALSSLLGLIMATSACPVVSRLHGLARLHLPFQSLQESHTRMVGAWLIGQVLDGKANGTGNLDGLQDLMNAVGQVNRAFMNRLQTAVRHDASLNAIANLAASAMNVQFSLDDAVAELADFAIR